MNNQTGYLFAIASMFCNVACQQFLSRAFKAVGGFQLKRDWPEILSTIIKDYRFWTGGSLAGACLVLWAIALSQLPISRVLPVMALLFVASPLVASALGDEIIRPINVVGFAVITVGVVLSSSAR